MSSPRSHHLEFLQLQLAVADAAAGLELVFVAVPRTDEVHLVGEGLALIGAVRADHVDHLVDQQPSQAGPPEWTQ